MPAASSARRSKEVTARVSCPGDRCRQPLRSPGYSTVKHRSG